MNEEQIMLIQAKIIFSLLLFMLMVFIFCNNSKNDSIYLNYSKNYNSCNKEGIPNDSLIEYFPSFLFNQKVPSILFGDSIVFPLAGRTKEEFIKDLKVLDLKIHELKDTFEYEQDTFSLRLNSYLLFKMNEPILYDHYLGKDIYRLIVLRSFDLPIAITLEKCDNKYVLKSKILNRNIGYPFMKYNSDIKMIDEAGKEIAIKWSAKEKAENDSIAKDFNNCNYYLIQNKQKNISRDEWNKFCNLIDSTFFWKNNSDAQIGLQIIDGSKWIFEGHLESGYQFMRIHSPTFNSSQYENYQDRGGKYGQLFKFIMSLADLQNERLY